MHLRCAFSPLYRRFVRFLQTLSFMEFFVGVAKMQKHLNRERDLCFIDDLPSRTHTHTHANVYKETFVVAIVSFLKNY